MLQIDIQPFASDAIEDAMRLCQIKALNSFTFSDCLNYLNYTWQDIFQRIVQFDEGYYSKTVQLKSKCTRLPKCLKNTIRVYAAQRPVGFNRDIFRASGYNDLESIGTYHISGWDLYCPDAERRTVWLNYIPQQPMIFYTRNNRDPVMGSYERDEDTGFVIPAIPVRKDLFNLYTLKAYNRVVDETTTPPTITDTAVDFVTVVDPTTDLDLYKTINLWLFEHRDTTMGVDYNIDLTNAFIRDDWDIVYVTCDYPYIFMTYQHKITGEHYSGFWTGLKDETPEWVEYNPFAFIGRNSDVEYLECKWNDKTGLGVTILDYNDLDLKMDNFPRIKTLGWTPDTEMVYPAPEMYRLLVARLADKFSALNESTMMAVGKELTEATYAFDLFIKKDKSAWSRIDNVNGPTIADLL